MYSFQIINGKSFDELPFDELKEKLKPEIIKNEISLNEIEKMEPCMVHETFSLINTSRVSSIYLIKKENGTAYFWRMSYLGTSKNGGITDLD